ncbi:hypothetical protein OG754_40650 (plasmid) [Streptomyces decoyicus]|uniref:hypothetical protein n=1 Tax=Streptomyces decoyicus TaxID=249567 RepID=UPI002E3575D4|nr:hypothetical protein [Streptomyces decoyicus]
MRSGLGQVATGIDPDTGTVQTTDGEDPMPVALFEPERAMMSRLPGNEPKECSPPSWGTAAPTRPGFYELAKSDGLLPSKASKQEKDDFWFDQVTKLADRHRPGNG